MQTENRTDLQLILHEFKSLKDTVNSRVSRLEAAISKQEDKLSEELQKLEDTLSKNTSKASAEIKKSVIKNSLDIAAVLNENKLLRKENDELKDRISRIESTQLCNNVILTGIPEQQWEPYETTKQRVFDTIASAHTNTSEEDRIRNKRIAENTKITYCTRVGRYRPNQTRPISVTFQNKEDKDQLMQNKNKLPPGMKKWINDGYSLCYDGIHAKFNRNKNLLMMLKSTAPKVLVEATLDPLWGTRISLRDHQTLNPDKWHNKGWMSMMLMGIRDEPTH